MDKELNNENKKPSFLKNLWNKIIATIRGEKTKDVKKLESGEKTREKSERNEFLKGIQQFQETNLRGDLVEKDNPETNLKGDLVEKDNPETNLKGDLVEKDSLEGESQADASKDDDNVSDTKEPDL